jgi:hypothetical protein
MFQLQSFNHGLEFLDGTQAGFDKVTNRIPDIGKFLQNSPESRRAVSECCRDFSLTVAFEDFGHWSFWLHC